MFLKSFGQFTRKFVPAVLHLRAFRHLWLGQAISQLGDAFYYVVFMFMVQKITGSNEMVGVVGAAEVLPYLLFGGYAGVVVDRLDRRRIMLWSDTLSGALLLVFGVFVYLALNPPAWTMVATPFVLSSVRAFFLPAKNAAIPLIVPEEMLLKANALSTMTQSFMPVIGLALSASVLSAIYSFSGVWFFVTAIALNGVSFLGSAAYIRLLPPLLAERRREEEKHPWSEFLQGVGYIKRHPVIRVYMGVSILMNLMISPFFVVYVGVNTQWFGGTPGVLCLFEMTFFVGLVISSAIVSKFSHRKPGLGYCYSLAIVGLAVAAMGYSHKVLIFSALNLVCGLAIPFCDIPLVTYIQLEVADALRGRVDSVLTMMRTSVMPLGMILGGTLVERAGLLGAFLVMGFGMVFAAALGYCSSAFRRAEIRAPAVLSRKALVDSPVGLEVEA